MKNLCIILTAFSLLISCSSYKIVSEKDPFKGGATVHRIKMRHKRISGNIKHTAAVYEREVKGDQKKPITISLYFQFKSIVPDWMKKRSGELKQEAYILVDDNSHTLTMKNVDTNKRSLMTGAFDARSYGQYTTGQAVLHSASFLDYSADITLTKQIEEEIARCTTLMIRVYAGKVATTLEVTPKQIEAIKRLLAAGEKE